MLKVNIQKLKYLFLLPLFLLCAAGCDDSADMPEREEINIKDVKVTFSNNYKNLSVKMNIPDSLHIASLTHTSTIRIVTDEKCPALFRDTLSYMDPVLTKVTNIRQQEISRSRIGLLLLVDLTLSAEDVDKEKKATQFLRNWVKPDNLHIAFIQDKAVTQTYPATDYVINNYFKKSNSQKLLYRSVLQKLAEADAWNDTTVAEKSLIVFSDGATYHNNLPIDPEHYQLQQKLLQCSKENGACKVYFAAFGTESQDSTGQDGTGIMERVATRTNGLYQHHYDGTAILSDMLHKNNSQTYDYQLDFVNPDNKVYVGKQQHLFIKIYDQGNLVGQACAIYSIGEVYKPVIINGLSTSQIMAQSLLLILVLLALVWLALQFLVPYVQYRLFKRKHVTHYSNANMILNGQPISSSCYYCKAPFEEGDEIVAKCEHTMHMSCWEENEYKCPEHGRKCKEGSHYYNQNNLFDTRNAPFYTQWILLAMIAGFIGWIFFQVSNGRYSAHYLNDLMLYIRNAEPGSMDAQFAYDNYVRHLVLLPIFGLSQNFFLCLTLSYLSMQGLPYRKRMTHSFFKACFSGIMGYLIFVLTCVVSIVFNLTENKDLIYLVPWAINGFIICYSAVYNTRIQLSNRNILISAVIGICMMLIWENILLITNLDNREALLLCYVAYSIAIAVCVAVVAPRSEHYFLHAEGAMKPMDIALYKWLRTSPNYKVSIGKSVDCNLQMTWDFASQIAPIQAIVYTQHGKIFLEGIEEGVMVDNNKPLDINEKIKLYHGRKFTIGKTTFTYVEKDMDT